MLIFQVLCQRQVFGWHLAAPLMIAVTSATLCLSSSAMGPRWTPRLRGGIGAFALAVATTGLLPVVRIPDYVEDSRVFLDQASTHLRDNRPAFRVDGSAILGWFCDCRLINGDGVVTNLEFLRDFLATRRIREYLAGC
jgi:hypothetical protein